MSSKPCCAENRVKRSAGSEPETPTGPTIADRAKLTEERMAMCLTCPRAGGCEIGKPDPRLGKRLRDPASVCPEGWWPAKDGTVQVRLTWEGVPFPRRVRRGFKLALWVFMQQIGEDKVYRGCGCVRSLMWLKPFLPWGKRGWGRKLAEKLRRPRSRPCGPSEDCPVHGHAAGQ